MPSNKRFSGDENLTKWQTWEVCIPLSMLVLFYFLSGKIRFLVFFDIYLCLCEDRMRFGIAKPENLRFRLSLRSPFAIFVTRR